MKANSEKRDISLLAFLTHNICLQDNEDIGDDDLVTVVEGQQVANSEQHRKDYSLKYQVSMSLY